MGEIAEMLKKAYDSLCQHLPPQPSSSSTEQAPLAAKRTHECEWCMKREVKPEVARLREMEVSAEQLTPEWYESRESRITASDIPSILCRGNTSRIEVLRRKTGINKKPFSAFANQAMEHGRKHEDQAIKLYEEESGHRVLPFGLLVDPERAWLGASPDGITYCGISIECKCPYSRTIRPGEVPAHYMDQVQTQLFVSQLKKAAFVQWNTFQDVFDVTYVDYDEDWYEDNVGKMYAFYEQMQEVKKDPTKIVKYERKKKRKQPTPRKAAVTIVSDDNNDEDCASSSGSSSESGGNTKKSKFFTPVKTNFLFNF